MKIMRDNSGRSVAVGKINLMNSERTGKLFMCDEIDMWRTVRECGEVNKDSELTLIGLGKDGNKISDYLVYGSDGTIMILNPVQAAYKANRNKIKYIVGGEDTDNCDIKLGDVFDETIKDLCSPYTFKHEHLDKAKEGWIAGCAFGLMGLDGGRKYLFMSVTGLQNNLENLLKELDNTGILWLARVKRRNMMQLVVNADMLMDWLNAINVKMYINSNMLENKSCIDAVARLGIIGAYMGSGDRGKLKSRIDSYNKKRADRE